MVDYAQQRPPFCVKDGLPTFKTFLFFLVVFASFCGIRVNQLGYLYFTTSGHSIAVSPRKVTYTSKA